MLPVIAIFDIGKTNKKFFLFNEDYKIVEEYSKNFLEIQDEDGFACEDIQALSNWIINTLDQFLQSETYDIKAINFSAYGASFVHIDKTGNPVTPLYNYLKPYLPDTEEKFYQKYGSRETIAVETASPALGNLNSGFQLYALKYEKKIQVKNKPDPEVPVKPISRVKWMWWSGAAAASVIALFLILPATSILKPVKRAEAKNTVSTNLGSKSKIQLPDGTQVWLNSDSKLTYSENFQGPFREVSLTGEAYFDVVKDKEHPFLIHTQSIDLKVLGTAFNVRSYANEKKTETSLIHGSVEVTLHNNPDKKIILKPNEKLVIQNNQFTMIPGKTITEAFDEDEPIMVLSKVHFQKEDSSATETLWVKNKLGFDGETLENIASKIERWYDVKIIIREERLKSYEYSGVFEDESLQQVMDALKLTGNFNYTINKKEVIITP